MFNLVYSMNEALSVPHANLIPCAPTSLYWNPFQKFFFYYYGQMIVVLDAGTSGSTGDACSQLNSPVSTTFNSVTLVGVVSSISDPTYYSGFTYFVVNYVNGTSAII